MTPRTLYTAAALLLLLPLLACVSVTQAQSSVAPDDPSRTYRGLTAAEHAETTTFFNIVMNQDALLGMLWGTIDEICDRPAVSCSKYGVGLLVSEYVAGKGVKINPPDLSLTAFDGLNWDIVNVAVLNFSNVRLSSSVDIGLGRLTRLTVLDFSNTAISGQLPGSLNALTSLAHLNLQSTGITGFLPSYTWASLARMDLSRTAITGTIPSTFVVNERATVYLADTNLCGCLPASWSSHTRGTISNEALTGEDCAGSCSTTTTTGSPNIQEKDSFLYRSGAAAAVLIMIVFVLSV